MTQVIDIRTRVTSISRQLHGWINSLQNSDVKGQRYLNDNSRRADKAKRDREEFLKELEAIRLQAAKRASAKLEI